MEKALARIENLRLDYGSVTAVKHVSFEIHAGEILAVIGPNGAGKTSAIECLEGLRRPSGGTIELFGLDPFVNRRKLYEQIGVQLQEVEYPDRIKVKELCRLFSSFYHNPVDWKLLLEQFGLSEKAGRAVRKLSGGEKQRLSILLALLPRPRLLILDELTTGLDPEVRRGMWESLKHIKAQGTAILLVSHYMDEVEHLADRLVYMTGGCAAFVGTREEFRTYAAAQTQGRQTDTLSLEELYLLLSPKSGAINLEGII